MIVLGAGMHKSSHTIAVVIASTGEMLGDKTAAVGVHGFGEMLDWARGLGAGIESLPTAHLSGPGA